MRGKNIFNILMGGLVCLFLLLNIYLVLQVKGAKATASRLESRLSRFQLDSANTEDEREVNGYGVLFNNTPANDSIVLGDEKKSLRAYRTQLGSPKLILRFSYLSCNVCVDSVLKMLKRPDIGWKTEDVVLLLTYSNLQDLRQFEHVNRITHESHLISTADRLNKADQLELPYMFVMIPESNNLLDVFFPLKENPARTRQYLNLIRNKYFLD
jgi:hypothetical protein